MAWLAWVVTFTLMLLTVLSVQAVGDRPLPSVYGLGHGFLVVGSTLLVTFLYASVGAYSANAMGLWPKRHAELARLATIHDPKVFAAAAECDNPRTCAESRDAGGGH